MPKKKKEVVEEVAEEVVEAAPSRLNSDVEECLRLAAEYEASQE